MGTVLEKPVLLDETGQAIVDKLDDIKEAIGGSGEFIPIQIVVTTPPIKTSYYVGDTLDLTGIVVKLEASNGAMFDVTNQCTFAPANGTVLTASDTSIAITYHWYKDNIDFSATQPITITSVSPVSIAVTTPPTKTEYVVGDTLDLTGIAVTVTYNNGTTSDVTSSCTFSPQNGSVLNDSNLDEVIITYVDPVITRAFSTTQVIDVALPIYGVEWDGVTDNVMSRTDGAVNFVNPIIATSDADIGSSPFDNIMPWSGMQIVEDADAGTLVSIPKFYYKWTKDDASAKIKLQISPMPQDGFSVSPAHMDRGDGKGEKDVIYVGRYFCNTNNKSAHLGALESSAKTATLAVWKTALQNIDTSLFSLDFTTFWTLLMLAYVEFATWDVFGVFSASSDYDKIYKLVGSTDDMAYHTGTVDKTTSKGSGINTQYRHIEGLFSKAYTLVNGAKMNERNVAVYHDLSTFDSTTNNTSNPSGYVAIPIGQSANLGWYKVSEVTPGGENGVAALKYVPFPTQISTSGTSPIKMYFDYNHNGIQLIHFSNRVGYESVARDRTGVTRLIKLPNAT